MIEGFCAIGVATVFVIGIVIFLLLISALKSIIHELKWKHIYKHRFDKPPTAKCYCKDCVYHDKDNRCSNLSVMGGPSYYTADNWFCWKADPRKYGG